MNNTIQSKQTRRSRINSIIDSMNNEMTLPGHRSEYSSHYLEQMGRFGYLTNEPGKKDLIQEFAEITEIYRKYDIIAPDTNLENMTTEKATRLKNSFQNCEAQLDNSVQQSLSRRVVTQEIMKPVVAPQQVQQINKREVIYGIFNASEIVLMIKHFLEIDYGIDNDIKNFFSISTSFQRLSNKRVIVSLDTFNQSSFSNTDEIHFAIFNQHKIHLKIRQDYPSNFEPKNIEFINTTLKELIEIVTIKDLHIYEYGTSLDGESFSDFLGNVNEVFALSSFPNLISLNIGNLVEESTLSNLTNLQSLCIEKIENSLTLSNLPNLRSLKFKEFQASSLTMDNLPNLSSILCSHIKFVSKFNFQNVDSLKSFSCKKIDQYVTLRFEESPMASFYCEYIEYSTIKFIKCLNLHSVYFEKIQDCEIQLENLPALQNLTCNHILDAIYITLTVIKLIGISKKISFSNNYCCPEAKISFYDADSTNSMT